MPSVDSATSPAHVRGGRLLAPAAELEPWLHASVVALLLASTVRYLSVHGLTDLAGPIVGCTLVFLAAWFAPAGTPVRRTARAAAVVALFVALALLAPSFSWLAAPVAFLAMRDLSYRIALGGVAIMVAAVAASWTRVRGDLDPTVVVGPVCLAVLAVVAYRALAAQTYARQRLLDELRDAQRDLVAAERRTGALAERARLSRDLHDSVAQQLSSINLLLQAAEQDWSARPSAARSHLTQAALASRDSLGEVRRVVADLAPDAAGAAGAAGAAAGETTRGVEVMTALTELAGSQPGLAVEVHCHGEPDVTVPTEVATALVRTARGALANVREHSGADRAWVSVTWEAGTSGAGEVLLDVRDQGRGFDASPLAAERAQRTGRGYGLSGMRDRLIRLGGTLAVESAPGEGTVVAAAVPLTPPAFPPESR